MNNGIKKTLTTLEIGRAFYFFVIIALCLCFMPETTLAGNLGAMASTISGQTSAVGSAIKSIAILVGLCLVVGSIVIFAGMKKNQTPASIPLVMLVAGILLVSITAFVGTGSETLFNSSSNELSTIINK